MWIYLHVALLEEPNSVTHSFGIGDLVTSKRQITHQKRRLGSPCDSRCMMEHHLIMVILNHQLREEGKGVYVPPLSLAWLNRNPELPFPENHPPSTPSNQ
jgi:hypothetical protein